MQAISSRRPLVIWNPYRDNDTLSRQEFVQLVKIGKYRTLVYEGAWIFAYKDKVTYFGVEELKRELNDAREKKLDLYVFMIEEELEQLAIRTHEVIYA